MIYHSHVKCDACGERHTPGNPTECIEGLCARCEELERELQESNDALELANAECDRLRDFLREVCARASSGYNCGRCGLPTAETEYIVGFGVCQRCIDRNLDAERWKKLRQRIEDAHWVSGAQRAGQLDVMDIMDELEGK